MPTIPPDPITRLLRFTRRALISFMTIYAVMLAAYLLLRLAVGDSVWWMALANNFTPYYFLPPVVCVPLALILREWRTAARLIPLALIGALWFGPHFLPKAAAVRVAPALTLLTFNVFPDNPRMDEVADWLWAFEPDVVLLQEVSGGEADTALSALSDVYSYQADGLNTQRLFTDLRIRSQQSLELAQGWSILRVTLDTRKQPIAIYNVHFPMPVGEMPRLTLPPFLGKFEFALKYDDSLRNAQIARLLDILKDEELPYVVAGDFNMSDQSAMYGRLAAVMGDSFREAGIGFGASWPAGESEELPDSFPPLLRLDYIWHSPQFRAISAGQGPALGSDHLPLWATLELRGLD